MKVCVLGLGYVGLTLALVMATCGIKVYGVDSNKNTVFKLKKKRQTLSEKGVKDLIEKNIGKNLEVSEEIPDVEFDAFVISVGTPLSDDNSPIMDYLTDATKSISKKLKKGQLVVLRSTVPVGTTRGIIVPILEETGMKAGNDFSVVFAPERTAEGVALSEVQTNPQIIGGLNENDVNKAKLLFEKITKIILPVSSVETAEMIKLIDNTYRDVHFAYSNEIALMCEMLKIDAHECISKANYKYPRNKIPIPSPGVGGPCLTKDPYILAFTAKSLGFKPELIMHSRRVNEFVPAHLASKISAKLDLMGKKEPKIFVVGFAFKGHPETDDMRKSSTLILVNELKKKYSNLYGYDAVVSSEKISELGITPCSVQDGFNLADCVVVMNNHKSYANWNINSLLEKTSKPLLFVDTWNLFGNLQNHENVIYSGVGIE